MVHQNQITESLEREMTGSLEREMTESLEREMTKSLCFVTLSTPGRFTKLEWSRVEWSA